MVITKQQLHNTSKMRSYAEAAAKPTRPQSGKEKYMRRKVLDAQAVVNKERIAAQKKKDAAEDALVGSQKALIAAQMALAWHLLYDNLVTLMAADVWDSIVDESMFYISDEDYTDDRDATLDEQINYWTDVITSLTKKAQKKWMKA